MTRFRDTAGYVLTEVLVVLVIGTALLAGTLTTFTGLLKNSSDNDKRQLQVQKARNALDIQARQLRNLAKRLNNAAVIDTVTANDFIFQTSDPARTWVRYCHAPQGTSGKGRLWEQNQALATTATGSPVTDEMRQGCPSRSGWTRTEMVASDVANRLPHADRPMFTYQCLDGTPDCTRTPATYDQLVGVTSTVIIDTTPSQGPAELEVRSAVHLRNQNQAPVASLTWTRIAGSPRTVLLNASRSSDAEGRTLEYFWFLNTMPTDIRCDKQDIASATSTLWGGKLLGQGVTYTYTWPGTSPASGTAQTVGLVACDPGDRYGFSGAQTILIP